MAAAQQRYAEQGIRSPVQCFETEHLQACRGFEHLHKDRRHRSDHSASPATSPHRHPGPGAASRIPIAHLPSRGSVQSGFNDVASAPGVYASRPHRSLQIPKVVWV